MARAMLRPYVLCYKNNKCYSIVVFETTIILIKNNDRTGGTVTTLFPLFKIWYGDSNRIQ